MLAVGVLEREPDYQRRGSARRAVVEPVPLHRLPEHHQGRARRGARDARSERRRRNSSAARSRAWRTARCSPARAASPPTFRFPANGTCAWCARRARTAKSNRSTPRAALAMPGVHAVWTHRRRRAHSADRLPSHRPQVARALSPAGAGARISCAMSASRSRSSLPIDAYLCRRCRRLGRFSRSKLLTRSMHATEDRRHLSSRGAPPSPTSSARAMATSTPPFATRMPSSNLELSVGRHSGVPLETRGAIARYDAARDVLELHGAAKVPHWNRDTLAQMLGRAPGIRSALRRPCRRRLRHPRRTLSRGRVWSAPPR